MSQRPESTSKWVAREVITLVALVGIPVGLALLLLGSAAAALGGWLIGDVAGGLQVAGTIITGLGGLLWGGSELLYFLGLIGPPPEPPTPSPNDPATGSSESRASERSN